MRLRLMALAALLIAGPAIAKPPFVEPGTQPDPGEQPYDGALRPGDHYARLLIAIDKKGYPLDCKVKQTDIRDSEKLFWVCNAMMQDWHVQPVLVDGKPSPTTVERLFVLRGKGH